MPNLSVADKISIGQGLVLNCIGSGNIWVEEDYATSAVLLAQEIVLKSLLGTAPGQLELVFFDYNLRGLAAPFSALREVQMLRTLTSEQELLEYFEFLKSHIHGVNNVMQGREHSLIDFRRATNQAVEGYKLVVIAADLYVMEDKLKENLSILLSAGPLKGVSFLIVSAADSEMTFLTDKCQLVRADNVRSMTDNNNILQSVKNLCRQIIKTAIEPVAFTDVQDTAQLWQSNSTDGLTFALGKYGADICEVTLGSQREQRHNALVTGAVGQGKSNVIGVILHSLCQRYSPLELELYLLDFKEGVTLQAYSNIGQDYWLTHAKALGLQSDVDFGIAVMEHLFGIYEQRMAMFKREGVQSVKEYREKTGSVISRILLVIDEFQMMFEERESARATAALLSKCTRLFRAAGIHIILASQTIANGLELSKDSDIFAQTPIRIALKNSMRESEATLGLGNVAACDLRMGQAIVNLEYGALAANCKVSVAYAESTCLEELRRTWHSVWTGTGASLRAGTPQSSQQSSYAQPPQQQLPHKQPPQPPYVFDGRRAAHIASDVGALVAMRVGDQGSLFVSLGETVSVSGSCLRVNLAREPGRNIAIIGAGNKSGANEDDSDTKTGNLAVGMLQAAVISLALQNARGNAWFVICNLMDETVSADNNMKDFAITVQQLGFLLEDCSRSLFLKRLDEIADGLDDRNEADDDIFILGFSLDKMGEMPSSFERICKDGPANGVHVIGWWQKLDRFEDQIGYGNSGCFDIKAMLRVDAREVQRALGIYDAWVNKDNRAYVADSAYMERPRYVIPYSSFTEQDKQAIAAAIR